MIRVPSGMVGPRAGGAQRPILGTERGLQWQGAGLHPGQHCWAAPGALAFKPENSPDPAEHVCGSEGLPSWKAGRGSGVRLLWVTGTGGVLRGGRAMLGGTREGARTPCGPHQSVNCRPRARTVAKVPGRMVESGWSPCPCFWSGVSRPPGIQFPESPPPPTLEAEDQKSKQGRPNGPFHT